MKPETYYIASGEGLLPNYKIHYSFDDYSENGGVNFVNSHADSLFSGQVKAISESSDPADPFDYFTGSGQNLTGYGVFSGGLNQFYHSVSIQNETGLITGNENQFCFIISAETTSRQDIGESAKGPVTNNNILFSNMLVDNYSGDCDAKYGLQIGINAANRAYVETYELLTPKLLTYSNPKTPYSHNIWSVIYRDGSLNLGLYDINQEEFLFDSVTLDSNVFNSGNYWSIGSGINYDSKKFTNQMTFNSGLFAGKIKEFVFFDDGISNQQANLIARSLYSELYTDQFEVSETIGSGFSGLVTGVSNYSTEIQSYASGVNSTINSSFDFTKKQELTGYIDSGDVYYQFVTTVANEISGDENIYKAVYHQGSQITGVTGFEFVSYNSGISRDVQVVSIYNSGASITGTSYSGITGGQESYILTPISSGISGNAPDYLWPNQLTYSTTGDDQNLFSEIFRAETFELKNKGSLNNQVGYRESTTQIGKAIFLDDITTGSDISLYVNGKAYQLGSIEYNQNETRRIITDPVTRQVTVITECGSFEVDIFSGQTQEVIDYYNLFNIKSGDFTLSGFEVLENHFWTGERYEGLTAIYDLNQPTGVFSGDTRWTLSGDSSFVAYPNSIFDPLDDNHHVFFNGQKLISGLDYSGSFLGWSDYVTGNASGFLFLRPNISDSVLTGVKSIDNQYYFPNSNIVYFNGMRQDYKKDFIEHSYSKDLISGSKFQSNNVSNLYNIYKV